MVFILTYGLIEATKFGLRICIFMNTVEALRFWKAFKYK